MGHAHDRRARHLDCDQNTEKGYAPDERPGAVYGVDDPADGGSGVRLP